MDKYIKEKSIYNSINKRLDGWSIINHHYELNPFSDKVMVFEACIKRNDCKCTLYFAYAVDTKQKLKDWIHALFINLNKCNSYHNCYCKSGAL